MKPAPFIVLSLALILTFSQCSPFFTGLLAHVDDETMSRHYHKHAEDLRELVQFAESLTDSVSIHFPSEPIPTGIPMEQYEQVLTLLKRTRCERIITYSSGFWSGNTVVVFHTKVFTSHGYMFFPDNTVKINRWDPLGSDISGLYEIE